MRDAGKAIGRIINDVLELKQTTDNIKNELEKIKLK